MRVSDDACAESGSSVSEWTSRITRSTPMECNSVTCDSTMRLPSDAQTGHTGGLQIQFQLVEERGHERSIGRAAVEQQRSTAGAEDGRSLPRTRSLNAGIKTSNASNMARRPRHSPVGEEQCQRMKCIAM